VISGDIQIGEFLAHGGSVPTIRVAAIKPSHTVPPAAGDAAPASNKRGPVFRVELAWLPDHAQALQRAENELALIAAKQFEDRHGYRWDIGEDGWPVDLRHPANKQT
jgi:hypothetical protein